MHTVKFVALVLACLCCGFSTVEAQEIHIGTGGTGGTYYPTGKAMAKIFTENLPEVTVYAESTRGTVLNIELLEEGMAQLGFMDGLYYHAFMGKGTYEGSPKKFLRAVAPLYPEPIHIMASRKSGITQLGDFRGKKISIGEPGGSNEAVALELLQVLSMDPRKDIVPHSLNMEDTVRAFKDGKIDALILVGALGMSSVQEMVATGEAFFVPVPEVVVEELMEETPYWVPFEIPAGFYEGQDTPKPTYASWNILGTSDVMDEETIYEMTKALFEHREEVLAVSPKLESMDPCNVRRVLIPLHPGAVRYYREVGAF